MGADSVASGPGLGASRVARLYAGIHLARNHAGDLFRRLSAWDLEVAQLFFDPERAKFPLSIDYEWNLVRRIANWVPFLLLSPAAFSLLRKLSFLTGRC